MIALKTLRFCLARLLLFISAAGIYAQSVSFSVLHQFTAGPNDGASPYSEVIQGTDGKLYGTTWGGGTNAAGIVYRMNRDGTGFAILHHFGDGSDGATPYDGVTQGVDGFLYGTTYYGGTNDNGTVFKLSTNGLFYSVLYQFTNSPDGSNPYGGLVQGQDGALYGTTLNGGSGSGTVFRIDTNGNNCSVLHSFTNFTADATEPFGRLVQAGNGMLYGTTFAGGSNVVGAVFQINTNGQNYSVLHGFGGVSDGFAPECGLLIGKDGWLYGTTVSGGASGNGTVFKLSTNGASYSILRSFTNSPDAAHSYARVAQGPDGYLYGVTSNGGTTNKGAIFRLNTNGANYSVIYNFHGDDGEVPMGGPILAADGMFYGTTLIGGSPIGGFGTVYRFATVPTLHLDLPTRYTPVLTLTGVPGQVCEVQASTNLVDWTSLTTVTLTNGVAQFPDPTATNSPNRYYRALVP